MIDLKKKAEHIGRILLTKGVKTAPIMRVGLAIDVSGSMIGIYNSGKLQAAFDQMMGVSVKFDDNGELDVFQFNNNCKYIGTSSPTDYENYIRKHISIDGATSYAPIVEAALDFFFKPKKTGGFMGFGGKSEVNDMPVLMIVLTDGQPDDDARTLRALEAAGDKNIYWHFVGIGGDRRSFSTIARLADALANVGEVYLPRIDMSDDEIYEQLICDELVEWIGSHHGTGKYATA